MKNIIAIILLFLLSVSITFAQETSPNKFYFRYMVSKPTITYGGLNSLQFYKKGGAIEFGSLFYFDALSIGKKSKFGIDVNYLSVSKHTLGSEINLGLVSIDQKYLLYNVGSKIGPVYTYSLSPKMSMDFFAKVNPIWINGCVKDFQDGKPFGYYIGTLGLKYSFGLNFRYDFFVMGAELNLGKLKYQSTDDKNLYLSNFSFISTDKYTNSPTINLSLGFCF